jgi:dolichol kinase
LRPLTNDGVDDDGVPAAPQTAPTATRQDLQLGRRLFHLTNGVVIATAYALLFTHRQVVHLFGTITCLVYILDRVRIHYPELLQRTPRVNTLFFRAEEQLRESAMTPYAIAILLTLITFPKPVALIAIYTLAIADPLSAIVGISWGRLRVVPNKTVEGSSVFFGVTAAVSMAVLAWATAAALLPLVAAAVLIGVAAALFEMLPLRLDDNLTIPLFVGFAAWIVCSLFGIALTAS